MSSGRSDSIGLVVREVLDQDVDWQGIVRRYPLPAVLVAGVAGFVLGRQHGPTILGAASGMAASYLSGGLEEMLGRDGDWEEDGEPADFAEAEPEDDGVFGAEEGATDP